MRTRVLTFLICIAIAGGAFANATITIRNTDPAGVGFNDPAPAEPVGGNNGTTIGEQRVNAFNRAAEIWGKLIDSPVEIIITASFPELSCTATTATLGSAGATQTFADFENAPQPSVWYPVALANKFAGRDLAPAQADIRASFNRKIGQGDCLANSGWYYGFDGNHGEKIDLVVVLLHEFAHGLGFASFTNHRTGALFQGDDTPAMPNVFETHMVDGATGLHWAQLTDLQRVTAATNDQNLFWDGEQSVRAGSGFLGLPGMLRVNSPAPVARIYPVVLAAFGSKLTIAGVTASLAAAQDVAEPQEGETVAGTTSDGCSAYLNASAVVGRIALVDRGRCTFVLKAQNAQAAGAIALVVANSSNPIPTQMAGSDPTLDIPVILITQSDGQAIRAELANGVNVTIGSDTTKPRAGTNENGLLKLYAPAELSTGSSVSHWDTTANPNTLMEPNINDDLPATSVDITLEQMLDIGWTATPKTPSGRRVLRRGRN